MPIGWICRKAPAKKKAARTKIISALVAPLGTNLADVRDRALLLIGFAGALRRSELVALDVNDISEDDQEIGRASCRERV